MQALKSEVVAVQAAIEQPHETAADAAKAAIAALDQARTERVTHFAVLRFGHGNRAFFQGLGPYSTRNQAVKAIEKYPATNMSTGCAVVPTLTDEGLDALLAKIDAPPAYRGQWVEVYKDAEAFRNGWKGENATRDRYL